MKTAILSMIVVSVIVVSMTIVNAATMKCEVIDITSPVRVLELANGDDTMEVILRCVKSDKVNVGDNVRVKTQSSMATVEGC
jgi:hypothetical protein